MRITLLFLSLASSLLFILSTAKSAGPSVVFNPPANWLRVKTASARSILLKDGSLLATFDADPTDLKVYFPIYRSVDGGNKWKLLTKVFDQAGHGGLRWQASFLQLESQVGSFMPGTILLAGNAVPDDHSSTNIDLYASTNGVNWKLVTTIATGGVAEADNNHHAIWEPNLVQVGNKVYCFYSDSRNPKHGQMIVHQSSTDLKKWSPVVTDVVLPDAGSRPGMPTVAKVGNGEYIMTYEFLSTATPDFPVYYKIAQGPDGFGKAPAQKLVTNSNYTPTSSPWVVWTSAGGPKGSLVANAKSSGNLFINRNYGVGKWDVVKSNAPAAYSRSLQVGKNPNEIMIASAGPYRGSKGNVVTFTITDLRG